MLAAAAVAGSAAPPSRALPSYSLRYNVACETCHTVAPRLNAFGRAFQANYFNWPGGGSAPARPTSVAANGPLAALAALPVAAIATPTLERGQGERSAGGGTGFRALELYPSNGFTLGPGRRGGYFVDLYAATARGSDSRPGDLENAFVALPFAGRRGEWALVAGQATPLLYQYDGVNSMTDALPHALTSSETVGGLSLIDPVPMVRADYFSGRGGETADGNYVSVGLPFEGRLALNREGRWGRPMRRAVFAQAFRRTGPASVGVAGYGNGGDSILGLIATRSLWNERVLLTAIAARGRGDSADSGGGGDSGLGDEAEPSAGGAATERRLSLEATCDALPGRLALTGRWEAGSAGSPYPVAAVTFYPLAQKVFRLSAETSQQPGARSFVVAARVQF